MTKQVLIVHGWSDTSTSFRSLARFLAAHGYTPVNLWLGDYISCDDDVRIEDVGKRMGELIDQMIAAGELAKPFDMIVHSTGGLVARQWLTAHYQGRSEECPMKRLVMLAPANFGSKLAATGKSFLGRVVKGYNNWFQTGQSMLNDLELSSPFQWELAGRDVLVPPGGDCNRFYHADGVWPFVLVGTHPYAGALRQIVNENGSDGTIRVCAANLNARGITLDFRETDEAKIFHPWANRLDVDIPLAVLPTRTHGSIVDPERADRTNKEKISETEEERKELGNRLLQALACPDFDTYRQISDQWDQLTEHTAERRHRPADGAKSEYYHQYMQVNTRVVDDFGRPVSDYFLEFYSDTTRAYDQANVYLHGQVIEDVKTNTITPSLRNLYIDNTDLREGYYQQLPSRAEKVVYMSLSAAAPGNNINYFQKEKIGAEQQVRLHLENDPTRSKRWLRRNMTHFVHIIIPRLPNANVFTLTNFGKIVG